MLNFKLMQHKDRLKLKNHRDKTLGRRDLKAILKTKEDLTIQIQHPTSGYNSRQLKYFVVDSVKRAGKYSLIKSISSAISSPLSYLSGFWIYGIARYNCFDTVSFDYEAYDVCNYLENRDFSNFEANIGMLLMGLTIPLGIYAVTEFISKSVPYLKLAHKFDEGDEFVVNGHNVKIEWIPEDSQLETKVNIFSNPLPATQSYNSHQQDQPAQEQYQQPAQERYQNPTDLEDQIAQLRNEIQELESN